MKWVNFSIFQFLLFRHAEAIIFFIGSDGISMTNWNQLLEMFQRNGTKSTMRIYIRLFLLEFIYTYESHIYWEHV